MKSIEITVKHEVGLHARPAAMFVQTAQKHQADITVSFNDNLANAKSMLGMLGLGVIQGAQITITADGSDEEEALRNLTALIESNFQE